MNKYFSIFSNKRILITLLLGFSGGLPLLLIGGTLQVWLAREKVDIATIGYFALVGLPYAMKFLWAPLMDSKPLPFLGLRRGWLAATQVGLFLATLGLAFCDPTKSMEIFSLMAFLVAFFSASQDIVIDAYRTEIIEDESELGAGASAYITGYRLAMIVAGAWALSLADKMSWQNVYILMACINLVGFVTVLLSPEPKATKKIAAAKGIRQAVVQPFVEFFQRVGAMEILIFIMVYKISTLMATALTSKFLVDLGYSNDMIGWVTKTVGLVATILGTVSGAALMAKYGLKRSLWIFGVLQALVGLTFCLLARVPHGSMKEISLVLVIFTDFFFMGMGTAALTGFMMHFCSRKSTATQYALLTSVMAVSRVVLVAPAGLIVSKIGYDLFFIATVPLAIPGLLLLNRFNHWEAEATETSRNAIPLFDKALIGLLVLSLIGLSSGPIWEWQGQAKLGGNVTFYSAVGVLVVVFLGLIRPYLGVLKKPQPA